MPTGYAVTGNPLGCARSGAGINWASEAASASVLAQIARELLGRNPPSQIVDLLIFHQRAAMDGVLKPFQFGLQVIHARLEPLDSMPRIGLR
jgi:hypothetical protein